MPSFADCCIKLPSRGNVVYLTPSVGLFDECVNVTHILLISLYMAVCEEYPDFCELAH